MGDSRKAAYIALLVVVFDLSLVSALPTRELAWSMGGFAAGLTALGFIYLLSVVSAYVPGL
ncbi:hypothetical protein J26TS2_34680 [Shouchella clausii]|uniref:hypothetical protein n=1 Tax=Shouchella tritolerans TaxID=2979466 RepID=UPI000787CF76|nr:hypothetical protein [Shouchella tritolerans]GIN13601.1 hypothetical protein J26TS2_34680 [Shouchella clausii]